MREIRPSGSEGGVARTTPSLPLSGCWHFVRDMKYPGQGVCSQTHSSLAEASGV